MLEENEDTVDHGGKKVSQQHSVPPQPSLQAASTSHVVDRETNNRQKEQKNPVQREYKQAYVL